MDREKLFTFIKAAEGDLASVRSSLLIVAQGGDVSGIEGSRRLLSRLGKGALACGQPALAARVADCSGSLIKLVSGGGVSPLGVTDSLDHVAAIEAALLKLPLSDGDFVQNVDKFLDESFEHILPHECAADAKREVDDFEIDEETLEIFRGEAEELLAGIDLNLRKLAENYADGAALWEIRRNAHTLKGSAGIVGVKHAAEIAHRMEDLLDQFVEARLEPSPAAIAFFEASSHYLKSIIDGCPAMPIDYEDLYRRAESLEPSRAEIAAPAEESRTGNVLPPQRIESIKQDSGPIVRVSLDRLDELIKLSRGLLINHSALAERFNEILAANEGAMTKLDTLIETQHSLMDDIQSKLLRIRMVKFGNLETRLARTVHVTCLEEGKSAAVEIVNGDAEIDTQIIDALIEPLLHLLKNAVVHGIESPEVRRLIGKPEKGAIVISVEADEEFVVISIKDDGAGVAVDKLKEKAVAAGSISSDAFDALSAREVLKLIFEKGLTTATKVDLNAGRGIGMSIVKEAVESRGGTVHVESSPQKGSEFTIMLPLRSAPPAPAYDQLDSPAISTDSDSEKIPIVLIVDDSASVRRATAKYIQDAGFRAITANSGADALELLLNGTYEPDLILSDVEMPQIDGWEFLEYVKTDDNLGHIPIVMVTSLDSEEYRERALKLGASDYVVKPFNSADVDRVLGILDPVVA
ncbi:MAG: response regulator [Acidobacteria bacterium]|nr:response regulator [Acidobacteriota bacterium]